MEEFGQHSLPMLPIWLSFYILGAIHFPGSVFDACCDCGCIQLLAM